MMQTTNIQINTYSNETSNRKMSQVSLSKGFWFYFDHEGNDISLHGSAWSGKETVYFNNKPMSSNRNWKFSNKHVFEQNGHQYSLEIKVTSILLGNVEVTLYCDGQKIKTEEVKYYADENGEVSTWNIVSKVLVFIGCFVGGYYSVLYLKDIFG